MKKIKYYLPFIIALTVLVLAACSGIPDLTKTANKLSKSSALVIEPVQPKPAVPERITTDEAVSALEGRLESIYSQGNPSVVNIRIVKKVDSQIMSIPGFPFFDLPQGQEQDQEPPQQYQSGLGSGFVWNQEGYIVTNNHVVDGADKIEVTFSDGSIQPAELVGADPDSDLAVIKVDALAAGSQPLQLADSTNLKVGQLAIAIGNPFGLEGTMTVGFISALGRSLPTNEGLGPTYTIPNIIQTDAPINPGNSGGVLLDDLGQVIGVTAAIESPVQANAGIGFAIPSSIVAKVVPELISEGHYEHSWLGISGTSLVPDLAEAMDLDSTQRGVLIAEVMPNSPADKAGLRGSDRQVEIEGQQVNVGGDVITAIDNHLVREMDDLIAYLASDTVVGQEISLTILRDGKQQVLTFNLAARPTPEENQANQPSQGAHLGIIGLDVNSALAEAMNLSEDTQGVLVEQVEQGSPADEAGLRGSYKPVTIDGQDVLIGGDVITAVDGQTISGMQDLKAMLSQMEPDQEITLTVQRDGKLLEVDVTLGG